MDYTCGRFLSVPDLSLIDGMMGNSPEQIQIDRNTGREADGTNEVG
jgi:hypothetical protein